MPIIATAGHVDHGKSTLVEALTGRDPDRWAEEKTRGLTIDLGFAWTRLGDEDVGFVDVPGHERFIKNMLAGVGAVDVALFVVAADEGWMPQSEEHAAVLDLLDVRTGIVALTRADLVDDETIELAALEIEDRVAGTSLVGWPIVPTAAPDGRGIEELKAALANALEQAGPPRNEDRPRLWVDRAFTIAGAGTVVTGTLVGGAVHKGDELTMWPPGSPTRVRGLQSHERDVDEIAPGTRAALNLAGADRSTIARGAMLGRAGDFRATDQFLADLRPVRTLEGELTDRGAYHLHVGSGGWPVRLRVLTGDDAAPVTALVRAPAQIPLVMGDRFVMREVGRKAVVAGGRVLDPHPGTLDRSSAAVSAGSLRAVLDDPPGRRADVLLDRRGIARLDDLARDTGGGRPSAALIAEGIAVAPAAASTHEAGAVAAVRAFQDANPLRPGVPKASLATTLGLPVAVLEVVVAESRALVDDGPTVHTTDFAPAWGDDQEAAWQAARETLERSGLAVPRASGLGLDEETFHMLLRTGRLVRVGEDLVYLPAQLEEITAGLDALPDGFTVAEFRDAYGMTRRHAVPLLEWLDREGWTSRRGDVRTVRRRPSPAPDDARPR